jgi:hypothetical protein
MDKPLPPPKPLPQDCCGTGCIPCVMELYEEAMEDYRAALARWEASLQSQQAG